MVSIAKKEETISSSYLDMTRSRATSSGYGFNMLLLFLVAIASSSLISSVDGRRVWPWQEIINVKARSEAPPPSCTRIECPSYDVIDDGDGFEIRRYNSSTTVWISTSPIQDISFTEATRTGFLQLFDYIQGKNDDKVKIEMTAPVLTQISPSDGPFCESSFVVSFYVPKVNQQDPPSAEGLHVQRWGSGTYYYYAAVRRFSGFVSDSDIGKEAAALQASLKESSSNWSKVIERSRGSSAKNSYVVAQYNSPFDFEGRVNEIWLDFEMENFPKKTV